MHSKDGVPAGLFCAFVSYGRGCTLSHGCVPERRGGKTMCTHFHSYDDGDVYTACLTCLLMSVHLMSVHVFYCALASLFFILIFKLSLRKCGFVPNMLDTSLWTHTTKRGSLVFHVDDLLLAGTHQIIKEIFTEWTRDLELKSSEVTTNPTRYLGRTLVKTKEVYNFRTDASYVESMLEEFNMSALKSSPTLRWERRETDEKGMLANEQRVHRQLVGNCCGLTELTCAVRW